MIYCYVCEGIQGHTMFIDMYGNAEANYTVAALLPDADIKEGSIRRSLQPVGSFITQLAQLPVTIIIHVIIIFALGSKSSRGLKTKV